MPKATRVLAALQRGGWTEVRRRGSHRVLVKGDRRGIWAYHDGVDLGGPALARVDKQFGYTVDELRGRQPAQRTTAGHQRTIGLQRRRHIRCPDLHVAPSGQRYAPIKNLCRIVPR